MEYIKPTIYINTKEYDHFVSLGDKCPSDIVFKECNLYKCSYPFDTITSSPRLILKYLQNNGGFFTRKR
jgi:hypothetical protein